MNPMVITPSGRISGLSERGVEVYRGIPYAEAPRDELRWQPPQPVKPWPVMRPAEAYGPSAPQSAAAIRLVRSLIGVALQQQSQDCLYLNVWTPASDGGRRPVLVWIHGGAFMLGSGSTRIYEGARLAASGDVVVVTINYRLGALGFLDLGDVFPGKAESNLGIHDQIAALRWVHDHIEAFGGDPENVTIFGESAGGMSVGTLLGTPAAQGLFHRAVAQSGAAHNVSSPERAREVALCFLEELGVEDFPHVAGASVSDLVAAQQRTLGRLAIGTGDLPWQPSVDGRLIPEQPLAAIAAGRGAQVPCIIGTNRDEWKLFMMGDRSGRRLDEDGLRRRIASTLLRRGSRDPILRREGHEEDDVVERAILAYQGATAGRGRATHSDVWVAFQSDRIFNHPAHALAAAHSKHVAQTYVYRFDWSPPFAGGLIGACHGLEIPFVFGTLETPVLRPLVGLGRVPARLSRRMMHAWCAFARSGNPTHADLPAWPRYESGFRQTLLLARDPRIVADPFKAARRFWDRSDENPASRAVIASSSAAARRRDSSTPHA